MCSTKSEKQDIEALEIFEELIFSTFVVLDYIILTVVSGCSFHKVKASQVAFEVVTFGGWIRLRFTNSRHILLLLPADRPYTF